jgi:hypothetical protein
MDEPSRMARAQQMGFRTEMPIYDGSGASFESFQAVPTNAAGMVAPGVSVALAPEVANEFAQAARGSGPANPQVYTLVHRADNPTVLNLDGSEGQGEVSATLRNAFDSGHDLVMLRNYTSPGSKMGQNIKRSPRRQCEL